MTYRNFDWEHGAIIKPRFVKCKRRFWASTIPACETKAMLTPEEMATRIGTAIGPERGRRDEIADAMDVSRQAVDGWCRTGRVEYWRLPMLAHLTDVGLAYFWPEMGTQETAALTADQWRAAKLVEKIPAENRGAFFSTGRALGESAGTPRPTRKRA